MSEETQQRFLVALYLLDKEDPNCHCGHDDIASSAGIVESTMGELMLLILSELQDRKRIRIVGFGSQVFVAITPVGREEAENILLRNELEKNSEK